MPLGTAPPLTAAIALNAADKFSRANIANYPVQRKLDIATCQPAPQTITSTYTIRPTTTVTETVRPYAVTTKEATIITLLGNPTAESTTTLTATTTVLLGATTIIDTTSSTQYEVSTETQTRMETDTVVSTTTLTTTTTVPWAVQTCAPPARRRVFKFGRGDSPFPNKCSCYLTATQGAPSLKTATETTTEGLVTQTILEQGSQTPTITRIVTMTAYLNAATVSAAEVTETITEARTETRDSLITVVDTETKTVTSTETKTTTETSIASTTAISTATADPCADAHRLSVPAGTGLSGPNIALSFSNEGGRNDEEILSCCRSCFGNPGCAFFRVSDRLCEGFGVENATNPCASNRCPRGQPALLHQRAQDGYEYFLGECGVLE
ncbi:unnamed protein product [Clonostachys chloroleuca]|uniref:Uncharacterized protein n=1 Tax=Clonostachys chloroleuca TaxID=1926264 RepID=A0AA35Q5A4_9HYPO|nr:unnamed protein product [Clonostachys chloroleuca]